MNRSEIEAAIPHRPPFLFVDEVVERTDSRLRCRKRFTGDEDFYRGHYPHFPLTPGVLLVESGLQAGAILLSRESAAAPGKVPVATRIDGVKFKRMVRPGETIDIEVEVVERLADAFFMKAKITVAGQLAARFEFACALAEPRS